MTDQKIELSADTVLVKLYGGVTGVTRSAIDKGTKHDGRAVETTNLVTTRQADAVEAEKARKLLSKLRAIVDSYTTTVLNLTIANTGDLAALRAEVEPVQAQIEAHNAAAKFHRIDRALIMAPISLKADPAALTEICRQISDELKVARGFFQPTFAANGDALSGQAATLAAWKVPVDNWMKRTKGLGALFPTITGQVITDAIDSVKVLRGRVVDGTKAFEKTGNSETTAFRKALTDVSTVDGALGLLDTAIGLTVITDGDAKAASDAARAEGNEITATLQAGEMH